MKIIGVHTPETKAEKDAGRVKSKTTEAQLTFPVAIDNDKKTWNAWGNNWWPTVYVIDREGYMRYFWAGELNWKGAGGQKMISRHVRTLLREGR